jgi:hypothetical protein
MRILAFIKSPMGSLVVFVGFVAVAGLFMYRSRIREKAQGAQLTKVEATEQGPIHALMTRAGLAFKPPAAVPEAKPGNDPAAMAKQSPGQRTAADRSGGPDPVPPKPRALPLSLMVAAAPAKESGDLSKTYAPYGRLIPCQTVITLESSKLETPVIGLVTDDVWHNGRLIIPAGAEVHGRASVDRSRERIAASGRWVVVWRDGSEMNGTELVLNGIALDRSKDDTTGEFGLRDGSAGLVGELLRTDDMQEIKLFASTFLAGMANGLQQLQTQTSALGVTQIATGSARDAGLQGTADVLNAYARQIQEAIARDGFYVRVPAGKQFYLYVTQTIDQAQGTRGNRRVEDLWNKSHEN